ncbi:MAG: 3-methyl-2-oxobutanoate hydroxymethyltransferase [Bdellovibrionota bacterium]
MKIQDWSQRKTQNKKITMTTCYDAWSARIIAETTVDSILIGDSAAMVMHGFDSTLPIDSESIASHVAAVSRGVQMAVNNKTSKGKFLIGDMPFLSYRKGITEAMNSVEVLMKAGAHAVKLEGLRGHEDIVKNIVGSGVPVMGHLGLTPQSVHGLGGYKIQGRSEVIAKQLLEDALELQELGAFSVVLECVPTALAQKITQELSIPTIGIGAGPHCDGQVLVLQDLLGLSGNKFKFVRKFADGESWIKEALEAFSTATQSKDFPNMDESFE